MCALPQWDTALIWLLSDPQWTHFLTTPTFHAAKSSQEVFVCDRTSRYAAIV